MLVIETHRVLYEYFSTPVRAVPINSLVSEI